jgi:beta-carotene 3-hydroxylase
MPPALGYTLVTLAAFLTMEGWAWFAHKYIMHGWGWGWHKSHHDPDKRGFEGNDLYGVVFAILDVGLFWVGALPGLRWIWFIALGIMFYGVMYGVVHDGLVHQRWPFRITPKRGYAKRLVQAHRLHHAVHGRDGGVSFGFLYAPDVRHLKARLKAQGHAEAAPMVTSNRP